MKPETTELATTLNRFFLLNYPAEAARQIESFSVADILPSLREQPAEVLIPVWSKLVPLVAATLTRQLPEPLAQQLISEIPPGGRGPDPVPDARRGAHQLAGEPQPRGSQ